MRRLLLLLPALLLLLLASPARAADGDTPQKCSDDLITEFRTIEKVWAAVLDTGKDDTAKEKLPEVKAAVDRAVAVIARMQRFPNPPTEIVKAFHTSMAAIDTHIETITKILQKNNPVAVGLLQGATKKLEENPPPSNWLVHADTDRH